MIDTKNRVVVSQMAYDLVGNQILEIAYQVRQKKAEGERLGDYTIGDFNNKVFRIPEKLEELIVQKLREGHTNYPPAMGIQELRSAVAQQYNEMLAAPYEEQQILVGSGTRPMIFAAYSCIVDPGEKVVYGAPSWNNNHYCHLVTAVGTDIVTRPQDNFMLTAESVKPHIGEAVLIALNSPMNPSGTMIPEQSLRGICEMVLEENKKRLRRGAKPCYILFDHVYWRMTYGRKHYHPVEMFPEMMDYTIYTDGASKNYAGTGLRVGWAAIPHHIIQPMTNIIAHMGAWGPKAEQLALAEYLQMPQEQEQFVSALGDKMRGRLERLHNTLQDLKRQGLPVDNIPPQGGLFLSVYFGLEGYKTPSGERLMSNEDIRQYLLNEGKCAFVPFEAFGDDENAGWFRASVSGIEEEDIDYSLDSLKQALFKLEAY
jgi:aspartate aminotransferase